MKYFLVLMFALLLTGKIYGQNARSVTDAKVATKIAEFKNKGISKYISYYMECFGGARPYYPDSCVAYNKKYLVWKENGKSYRQRFDECRDYDRELISDKMYNIVDVNYDQLKKDSIKYPQHYDSINGKKELLTSTVDHSCITNIKIYWGNKMLEKWIDGYVTDTKYIEGPYDSKFLNINYKSNKRTYLYKLYLLTLKD
jgi:hypothetical protein